MVRVSKNLQGAAKLLLCAATLAGCSSSGDPEVGPIRPNLISFSPMFSAYDDGTHEFAVTPSIPSAAENSKDSDPVMASSIKWDVDTTFVKRDEFPELASSVKLTTKKSGETLVKVTAKTLAGVQIRGEAKLTISAAKQSEWDVGEARYNNGMMIQFMRPAMAAAGEGTCGLPVTIEIPKMSACGNCHNSMTSMISIEHTPTQTAGYSNDALINIFTQGAKPAGGTFNSPFLRAAPMPDCIYAAFHTWDMTDDEKKGIIWKLRSIAPKVQAEIDIGRLVMQMRAAQMAMPAP